jgi:hypothetical protein
MTDQQGNSLMRTTFFIALIVMTWGEVKQQKQVPRPARYVAAGMTWGILGFAAPFITYRIAGMLAVGFLLTLFYQFYGVTSAAGQDKAAVERITKTA